MTDFQIYFLLTCVGLSTLFVAFVAYVASYALMRLEPDMNSIEGKLAERFHWWLKAFLVMTSFFGAVLAIILFVGFLLNNINL